MNNNLDVLRFTVIEAASEERTIKGAVAIDCAEAKNDRACQHLFVIEISFFE